ncbi:LOW QUALITY PROTEIN: probable LRR receptor-like serine/threonine-protein kinase At3g47570 [Quercus suber]|uniref:LOW QUALITY PROTEIN: probable LRR receptor-like serine/threonine-protein kinase At3g47570 n=1 Tax=Quercus suber TaxID=58331 RepID=UPI0032DED32D
MWQNKFSGNIPHEVGKLHKLQVLTLNTNNFYGNIPFSIGNLTILVDLELHENNLQGNIPLSLSRCRNLFTLNLANNNLNGLISPQVIGLSFSPVFLNLSANQFAGILPMEIGNFINLERLDISTNMLSGKIPASLGSCIKLEFLYMGENLFQRIIPPSLESLRGLQYLELSENNLSGEIPKFLEVFVYLKFLNLSYNHFEGELPINGVFKNVSRTSVKGNAKLCGGIPKFQLPICKYKKTKKRKLTLTLKLIIFIASRLFGVTLIVLLLLLYSLRKKRNGSISSDSRNSLLNVSYQSLLNTTNGFSFANLIGVGSIGPIYKGILNHGRQTVAIKVLNLLHHGASKSFIAKCGALRNIRQRNLVKVITACSNINYQGSDFKTLIYKFLGNGNLDEWLHPTPRINEALEKPRKLSLLQRLNIAIDVVSALDYLHHHCQTPIVHSDLKPSNILLDDEMIGHVGNFGLATFLHDATQDCSTNQSSSIGVRGTIGYTPPVPACSLPSAGDHSNIILGVPRSNHKEQDWRLVRYFYEGLTPRNRQFVQLSCGGDFLQKEPEDAMDYLDEIAENFNTWTGPSPMDSTDRTRTNTTTSSGSVFKLREDDNMSAKISMLTKEIEALKMKGSRSVSATFREDPMEVCKICHEINHATNECASFSSFVNVPEEQVHAFNSYWPNNSSYSNNYNPNMRNHPYLSYKSDNVLNPPAPRNFNSPHVSSSSSSSSTSLEDALSIFIQR